ncbi:MAG TPA: 5-(carboxyamino)imidazole ribonucleotide synthase [Phycisphaerales bacterium]|nr:5-(carboxyamino)imidazole ribonucleotide synthase [Phycisphaerales bacterium]
MSGGTIGILGGGQLGRMLALAAHNLGVRTRCFDEHHDAVAGHVTRLHVDSFSNPQRLDEFLDGLSAVTYEFENVPVALAQRIAERVPCYPPPGALETAQDRVSEKTLFRELGIPTAGFVAVDTLDQLKAAATELGLPAVLKTRRLGYDGKGQFVLRDEADTAKAWAALAPLPGAKGPEVGLSHVPAASAAAVPSANLILEQFVPFTRELSIIAVRSLTGEVRTWPLTENTHSQGILRTSIAPAPNAPAALAEQAAGAVTAVVNRLGYVGVVAIEFFQLGGTLVANEMAPRVHNSGHWTQDGSVTSQFENNIRAVSGLPLGDCAMRDAAPSACSAMLNIIGAMPPRERLLAACGGRARLHHYGKEPRPGRKLGHVNINAPSMRDLNVAIGELRALIG